ncbi:hypothetical protein F2Q69_00010280 [Brassica cretica]|uniref:Flotillin-like n=1 Tax=Brassica cretica TaxID=69181 RepID=A0A8S9QSC9_BRACR|nr:hypothetical protein F2Q69_00010280 [Brassica cretica]
MALQFLIRILSVLWILSVIWKDLPKVVVLSQQTWGSFDRQRISLDWAQDVPCVTTTGKRIKLPLMGNIPKVYPSYNEILLAQLGGESFSSMSASEGEDAEPAVEVAADGEDIEVTNLLVEKTDVPTADDSTEGLTESAPGVIPSKKKKKNKSSRKAVADFEGGKNLAETDQYVGPKVVPVVPELAFPNGFIKSAQADMEAIVRQNQLILDYEQALWRMSSDLSKAEAAIETKDAEIEKSKRDALSKSKEMIAERTRYYCEHKVEEAEKAKKTLDRARGETPSSQPGFRDLRSDGHVGRLGDAEQGLIVSSLPRLEPLQGLNQFGSKLEIVDSEAVAALRYPALEVEHLAASLGRNSFDRAKTTVSEGRAAKLSEGTESAGATGAAVSDLVAEDQSP